MRRQRLRALAAFDEPRRTIAVGRPEPASFPSCFRIVDTPVKSLRVEADGIRHAKDNHAAVGVSDEAVIQVAG